jgi:polyhydroxyalkanoate synthase
MSRLALPRILSPRGMWDELAPRLTNGLRHAAGEPFTPVAVTPRTAVLRRGRTTLYRYDTGTHGSPVLIVHSLVTRSHVFDLYPGSSLVEDLAAAGHVVYLLDWGVPGAAEAVHTIEHYVDTLIPSAVRAVLADSRDEAVSLLGYCLGSVFAALAIAGNADLPARGLVMLAPPIDFRPLGMFRSLLAKGRLEPAHLLDETGNVPARALVSSFRMSQPTTDIAIAANYWQHLPDARVLGAQLAVLGWSGNHIPFPGAVFQQLVSLFLHGSALREGVVPLSGGDVHLSTLPCPVLCVTGSRDVLVPAESSDPLEPALGPTVRVDRFTADAGHAGLFVGRTARRHTVPAIADWLRDAS